MLGGSAAHKYMKSKRFGEKIDLAINPDVATVIGLVEQKRLDATVQDTPAALYYIKHGKGLMLADEPRKTGFYVILTRADGQGPARATERGDQEGDQGRNPEEDLREVRAVERGPGAVAVLGRSTLAASV